MILFSLFDRSIAINYFKTISWIVVLFTSLNTRAQFPETDKYNILNSKFNDLVELHRCYASLICNLKLPSKAKQSKIGIPDR